MSDLQKRQVELSVGRISYLEEGDPEEPAIVLLHGYPTSSYLWREFVPAFAPWFHVIAPDLVGSGDSDKPPDLPLHVRAQTAYLVELLQALGIGSCAAVGHGAGGGIAQLLALEGRVRAMVLVDSVAFDAWPTPLVREVQRRQPSEGLPEGFLPRWLRSGMGHPERLKAETLREYLRPFQGPEGAAALLRLVRALDGRGLAGREGELARLDIPILLLWGEDDAYLPVDIAERLAEAVPTASLAVLPGCSHFLPEDAPETIAPLMFEYLRSRYLGRSHEHRGGPVVVELQRKPFEGEAG
ncbi:MAG TPA: alpha/beta fold hydrolase [Actinomycetota bacterium]|nr:alpha/beta fold hydrolase [Actinomycetota bacterium]